MWTGAGIEPDYPKGDIDDSKDFIGRLFLQPFVTLDGSIFQKIYLCVEGSYGEQSMPTTRFETPGYGAAIRDNKFWTWETQKNNNGKGYGTVGSRTRWGGEVHYIYGPFALSSECLVADYDKIRAYDQQGGTLVMERSGQVLSVSSWVSWFITGESKRVSNFGWKVPNPAQDFDPVHFKGLGAWEILVRYTYSETMRGLFDTMAFGGLAYRILRGSPEVHEYSAGVNWTWNPMVRWQLNYVHLEGRGEGILSGDKGNPSGQKWVKDEQMYAVRMIFKF